MKTQIFKFSLFFITVAVSLFFVNWNTIKGNAEPQTSKNNTLTRLK